MEGLGLRYTKWLVGNMLVAVRPANVEAQQAVRDPAVGSNIERASTVGRR